MHRYGLALIAATLVACADHPNAPASDARPVDAAAGVALDGSIPGQYIVTLDWDADANALALGYGLQPKYVYEHLLNGFAAEIPDNVVSALVNDPRVLRVSVQRQMKALETTTQAGATWGLDRVDQRALPLDGNYTYDYSGLGVRAYIIDTGIRFDHTEFEGRAVAGWDAFAADPTDPVLGYSGTGDCEGHGTHVAGTVGGKTYGVAKRVSLVAVRVLNCVGYGSDADVIAGMDWVAKNGVLPAVVNMSLGDVIPTKTMGTSAPVDDAVKAMVASGITVAVAAGNGWGNGTVGADACMFPISNVPEAITVAATTNTDSRTTWTNYGACIDIFAPGSGIMSADMANPNGGARSSSGTSMATPHVAGAAALLLEQSPGSSPEEIRNYMVAGATQNVVKPTTTNMVHTMNSHLLHTRVTIPVIERKKNGKPIPCTPRRQRNAEC